MAIEERRPKKERRAEARAERKRQEEQERKARQKRQFTGMLGALVILAFIGAGVFFAFDSAGGGGETVTISASAAEEARNAAGCEVLVEHEPLPDAAHHDSATAPPADVMYAASEVRPAHSGPHFVQAHPPIGSIPSSPLEERAIVHNLEHGSVVAWFDAEAVDGSTQGDMENWMSSRQALGFEGQGGANVFVSPAENITSDKPIAFRAWGVAMDCDSWNQTVADSFLIDYWGTHGRAPERNLAPYPDDALGYSDATVEDATDAPTGGRHETEGTESPAAEDESPADDEPTPTEDAS